MLNIAPGSNPYQQYKRNAVETAPPAKLLIMLFDGAIKFVRQAQEAMDQHDYEKTNRLLIKVQDILSELMITLDFDIGGDIAHNLHNLYSFYRGQVIKANITKDTKPLGPVLEFLQTFRDVWAEAARLSRSEDK